MRRGCLITVIAILLVCVAGCGLGYFVALPRARDSARDGVRNAISTQVAIQIPAPANGKPDPGSYTLTEAELQQQLRDNVDSNTVNDIVITISETGFEFGLTTSGDQKTTYTGLPVAENGKLQMTGMKTTSGVLEFIFPAKDLGKAIEEAVNNYLVENDLRLDSLTLEDGSITLETVRAG